MMLVAGNQGLGRQVQRRHRPSPIGPHRYRIIARAKPAIKRLINSGANPATPAKERMTDPTTFELFDLYQCAAASVSPSSTRLIVPSFFE
jgi:hypothetical protein